MPQPRVQIFTDGSCLGNPGPGGWAAILRHPEKEKELSGGYKLTTNNRMELMAVIFALQALKRPCTIELYTDSRYVADAINKNWLVNWQGNGWKNAAKKPVKNQDLWEEVAKLLPRHDISLHWLKSHVGHPENERCDMLAKSRAAESALPPDHGFRAD